MLATVVIAGIVSLLSAFAGALIALKIQYGQLRSIQAHNEGWERAQENHRRDWEVKQEKYAAEVETRLTQRVQQVQKVWTAWEAKDQERIQTLDRQLKDAKADFHVKHELARLPHIDERPLLTQATRQHQQSFPNWQPPMLQGADLSDQDLSHRYLAQADLRHAKLTNANFFMADLSDAFLTGADVSGANLSGANLSGADLRGTILSGANFLVADLQHAILLGADLRGVRSLTSQQLHTAIYDETTKFDAELDIAQPSLHKTQSATPPPESPTQAESPALDFTGKMPVVPPAKPPETSQEDLSLPSPPETPPSDIELLIPQQEGSFSSSLSLSDSLLGQEEGDLPADTPENTHTEVFDTAVPTAEYNGNRRAAAN